MKKLIITRGVQGSGKSTALKNMKMDRYSLSPDDMRRFAGSPEMDSFGKMMVNHSNEKYVWELFFEILEKRMEKGETIFVDATNRHLSDIKNYSRLAQKHRYQLGVLDFSTVPLELAKKQNNQREGEQVLAEHIIDKFYADLQKTLKEERSNPEKNVKYFKWDADKTNEKQLLDWIKPPVHDLTKYDEVVHIGDLQGCFDVVHNTLLKEGQLDDNKFYIFVGDFLDRGIENDKVFDWCSNVLSNKKNVALLWGNHETHLHLWGKGLPYISREFETKTLPQLKKAGFKAKDADVFCDKLQDVFFYKYGEKNVMVSHAGLGNIPANPGLISARQYHLGTGQWHFPVDEQFNKKASENWFQVHGHRNHKGQKIITGRSMNLENRVEDGGFLRSVALTKDGWKGTETQNMIYPPYRERKHMKSEFTPKWLKDPMALLEENELQDLRDHLEVREKLFDDYPHISSFNFTRKAFHNDIWDETNIRARGLFVNNETREVVARGYQKFFNVGQRDDTSMSSLKESLVFPLHLFVKENGFFGTVGYDASTDKLFIASKTTPVGAYADWFRDIFENTFNQVERDKMKMDLRDKEMCFLFEVNDPVNDPHMIKYEKPHLILLEAVRRSIEYQSVPYKDLQSIGQSYGVNVKKSGMVFNNWKQFEGWHKNASINMNYKHRGEHIEGYVIEDSAGFHTKIKLPYYKYWKYMRSIKDRIVLMRKRPNAPLRRDVSDPQVNEFYTWALEQDTDVLQQDIISVRKIYGNYVDEKAVEEKTVNENLGGWGDFSKL